MYGGQLSGTRTLTASGKALDDPASSGTSGTQLITWTPHGGPNQQWQLTLNGDGGYTMVNGASKLCADVAGGATTAGAAVVQATCTGRDSQRWQLTALGAGRYSVANKNSALLLTTASAADGAQVTQQTADGSAYQQWQVV
ncbi:RICIN domain-containing protein [Streptomyces sp. ERV7]|uniref:RICIN domain-containing protein n=1 Tax=Streptomyces sp. ERV7 TaxID=1322334 RepID=UPI001F27ACDC|nr:RICIN domain-containing protein [Streptomyces sp. ERV7]